MIRYFRLIPSKYHFFQFAAVRKRITSDLFQTGRHLYRYDLCIILKSSISYHGYSSRYRDFCLIPCICHKSSVCNNKTIASFFYHSHRTGNVLSVCLCIGTIASLRYNDLLQTAHNRKLCTAFWAASRWCTPQIFYSLNPTTVIHCTITSI